MWCDDFDGDLFKLIPDARAILAPIAQVPLYTHGDTTGDAINHPCVWNSYAGMTAYFGTDLENIKPSAYYTDKPIVPCTVEQAIRDCWVHHFQIAICRRQERPGRSELSYWSLLDGNRWQNAMMQLLMDARGAMPLEEHNARRLREMVLNMLRSAVSMAQANLPGVRA